MGKWAEVLGTLRVLPIGDPDDDRGALALAEWRIEGTHARVSRNGAMAYVAPRLLCRTPCDASPPCGSRWS